MSKGQAYPSFEWVRSEPIKSLNLVVEEYRHRATGAPHYHLAAQDSNNVFMVALRTIPQDSTGVAHILEHTTLCGSERYPVRDPFFMMTRRSLNTFMNAFTSSDWTAYPFASQNKKDFDNLLQVYLDAVFFPKLDPLDFAQEGHRLEFAETENTNSPLVYKGVVYNEMKGAMSSPTRVLWQSLTEKIFPTITYHHNSGGEPEKIPDLTYEQLKAFHAAHYHPSNAIFMTFGDAPAHEHQERFERLALHRFKRQRLDITIPDEQRYAAPQAHVEYYALEGQPRDAEKTYISLSWLLGKSTDLETMLTANLLSDVLLDNSASPLRHALETTDLGSAPSPICGLEDSNREMVFSCGVEGSRPEHGQAVEDLILGVLREIADQGVPREMLDSMLHQLELSQREIGGDHYPYGLQLMLNALSPAIHGGDPVAQLDIDRALERLRRRCEQPDFIQSLVKEWLLENPHRVRLTLVPDAQINQRKEAETAARLAAIKARLSEEEKRQIVRQALQLKERQNRKDDPEILPKVGLSDIPPDLLIPESTARSVRNIPATWYAAGTNGLVYQQLIVDLPDFDDELRQLLPLYADIMSEVGSGGRDYLATQAQQAAVTGSMNANVSIRGATDDPQKFRSYFVLSSKALVRNQAAMSTLMQETFESARFDELPRLRELIAQIRFHAEQGVTDQGHSLAMLAASSRMSPTTALHHQWEGLEGIKRLKALDDALENDEALSEFGAKLARIRDILIQAPRQLLVIGEAAHHERYFGALEQHWHPAPTTTLTPFRVPYQPGAVKEAWITSTQVNFCAKAYPTVAADHPDSPALMVLAPFLRNGFLHRAIREQGGAYGGGATYDGSSGSFRFYSYRDPRLTETLADFDQSLTWLLTEDHPAHTLEEAILGVIARIDHPASPAGEAKSAFHNNLHGRTPQQRRAYRSRVLHVTLDDLRRACKQYLTADQENIAVVCGDKAKEQMQGLGLEIKQL
ncbi:MAG: insulinase family protein [Pseudomonadota bacterium]